MDQIGWIRRLHRRENKSEREIARIRGLSRNTVGKWLHGELVEPRYRRQGRPKKLAPFYEALEQALVADARRPKHERRTARALHAQIKAQGYDGGYTRVTDFLRRLIKGQPRKLFLILDNLRVHHARLVKEWLARHAQAIEVFYLPSDSPELNPDELVNADLKQAVTKQAPARTKLQLVRATARHLRSVQKQPGRIQNYFQHDPVRYAA